MLLTKCKKFCPRSCALREEDFFVSSHYKHMADYGAPMDPRGSVDKIYKEDYYILLHTKYKSSRPCGFREEDLFKDLPVGKKIMCKTS